MLSFHHISTSETIVGLNLTTFVKFTIYPLSYTFCRSGRAQPALKRACNLNYSARWWHSTWAKNIKVKTQLVSIQPGARWSLSISGFMFVIQLFVGFLLDQACLALLWFGLQKLLKQQQIGTTWCKTSIQLWHELKHCTWLMQIDAII